MTKNPLVLVLAGRIKGESEDEKWNKRNEKNRRNLYRSRSRNGRNCSNGRNLQSNEVEILIVEPAADSDEGESGRIFLSSMLFGSFDDGVEVTIGELLGHPRKWVYQFAEWSFFNFLFAYRD